MYSGCTQPPFDATPSKTGDGWTWSSARGALHWSYIGGSPRSPAFTYGEDSIVTLTKDSLVLSVKTGIYGDQHFPNGNVYAIPPTRVTDVYIH
jgi:hypothetical protein